LSRPSGGSVACAAACLPDSPLLFVTLDSRQQNLSHLLHSIRIATSSVVPIESAHLLVPSLIHQVSF